MPRHGFVLYDSRLTQTKRIRTTKTSEENSVIYFFCFFFFISKVFWNRSPETILSKMPANNQHDFPIVIAVHALLRLVVSLRTKLFFILLLFRLLFYRLKTFHLSTCKLSFRHFLLWNRQDILNQILWRKTINRK